MMRNKITLLLLALLTEMHAAAQQPALHAALPPISKEGFFRILITPEITAYTTHDGNDLRIIGPDGKEVPYLKEDSRDVSRNDIHLLRVISRSDGGDRHTHMILHNDADRPLNELAILLRNTSAIRKVSLSGSRDGKAYFSLIDSAILAPGDGNDGDTAICIMPVPRTRYPFLQLRIVDGDLLPMELFGAGTFKDSLLGAKYVAVPTPSFRQKDSSDHRSYIRLQFHAPYRVNRFAFLFKGARLFRRSTMLYSDGYTIADFTADQAAPASVLTDLQARDIMLVVDNEDNPPLQLQSVLASQREQYLLAYLEPQTAGGYSLSFGDSALPAPVYDLRHFKDSISRLTLVELVPEAITRVQPKEIRKPLLGKGMMWAIILAVLVGVTTATAALMRQIKRSA